MNKDDKGSDVKAAMMDVRDERRAEGFGVGSHQSWEHITWARQATRLTRETFPASPQRLGIDSPGKPLGIFAIVVVVFIE